jgi:hypothetical protein
MLPAEGIHAVSYIPFIHPKMLIHRLLLQKASIPCEAYIFKPPFLNLTSAYTSHLRAKEHRNPWLHKQHSKECGQALFLEQPLSTSTREPSPDTAFHCAEYIAWGCWEQSRSTSPHLAFNMRQKYFGLVFTQVFSKCVSCYMQTSLALMSYISVRLLLLQN